MKTITLKTLPEATEQEVFDFVATHLLTQKQKSILPHYDDTGSNGCRYKMENGLKCAAGCLIADDEYDEKFELKSWSSLSLVYNLVPNNHRHLIISLQRIHDGTDVKFWYNHLFELADTYRLQWNFSGEKWKN